MITNKTPILDIFIVNANVTIQKTEKHNKTIFGKVWDSCDLRDD